MTERQPSYSTHQAKELRDRAKELRDRSVVAKKNFGQVEEQLDRCLDALRRSDPDLDSIEELLTSMARMLRDTADQLDGQ